MEVRPAHAQDDHSMAPSEHVNGRQWSGKRGKAPPTGLQGGGLNRGVTVAGAVSGAPQALAQLTDVSITSLAGVIAADFAAIIVNFHQTIASNPPSSHPVGLQVPRLTVLSSAMTPATLSILSRMSSSVF
jgi:hypothetical protein